MHPVVKAVCCLVGLLVATLAVASPFGINIHTPTPHVVGEVAYAGIGWVRIDFVWAFVEPQQDVYDWRFYDALLDDLSSRGLRVFATLQGTPQWATDGAQFSGAPRDPDDWRDLCYRAAARYRGQIHAWGFWNEPNIHFFDGSLYEYILEILLPGARAVRAADPDALLCGPELAHLQSGDWDTWLEHSVVAARHVLDVVTHHLYPGDSNHSDVTNGLTDDATWPWDPPSVREVLDDAGWERTRPFWLTETGVHSDRHGENAQAGFYNGLLADWFRPNRTFNWMDRVFFYQIQDDPNLPQESLGILDDPPGLGRKPAFWAYRDFIETSAVDDAEVAVEAPAFARLGSQYEARITLRNTGTTTWDPASDYRLSMSMQPEGWVLTGGELAGPVAPGEAATMVVWMASPTHPAYFLPEDFTFTVRMDRHGRWLFGDHVRRTVVLADTSPPAIVSQPNPDIVPSGSSATFTVGVLGDSAVTYRWRRNSIGIESGNRFQGVNTSVLTVNDVDRDVAGSYYCEITNDAGTVVSSPAVLTVLGSTGTPPRRVGGRPGVDPGLLTAWQTFRTKAVSRPVAAGEASPADHPSDSLR